MRVATAGSEGPDPDDPRFDDSMPSAGQDSPEKSEKRPQNRTSIRVYADRASDAVRKLCFVMSHDPALYRRQSSLVTITVASDDAWVKNEHDTVRGNAVTLCPGTPRVAEMSMASMKVRSTERVAWLKFDKRSGDWVASKADPEIVAGALACETFAESEHWKDFRPLRGILETPFLTPSGRLVTVPGYDPETGFVLYPSVDPGIIPETPTQGDAQEALRYLWTELYCDFPFRGLGDSEGCTDSDSLTKRWDAARACPDAFVAVGAILTILARPAILGAVMGIVFDANTQGAGKSKQAQTVSYVCTGRPAGVAGYPTKDGKTDDSEMGKLLASYALAGVPLVTLDNARGELGGGQLEGKLTAVGNAQFRLLGENSLIDLPWSALVAITGNGMTMTADMGQRVLVSYLDTVYSDPRSERSLDTYRHPDLIGWLQANRPRIVRAALTILRALFVSEKRPKVGAVGDFQPWANIVASAIVYAGGPDITRAKPDREAVGGEDSQAHEDILVQWPKVVGNEAGRWRLRDLVPHVFDGERHTGDDSEAPPDAMAPLRSAFRTISETPPGCKPNIKRLGNALRTFKGKWRQGRRLMCETDRTEVAWWYVQDRNPVTHVVELRREPDEVTGDLEDDTIPF